MSLIDFPNPPLTIGQVYNAPNGASYFWDGVVWVCAIGPAGGGGGTVNQPTGAAGGDLAGSSYPNPFIAPGVVTRPKLASDVTASLPPLPALANAGQMVVVNPSGTGLVFVPVPASSQPVIGTAPPAGPQPGALWWRNDPDGNLYVWYDDGNSAQWVPATSSVGPPGPATAPGGAVIAYHHSQPTAAVVWNVIHGLTYQPAVTVVDSTGTEIWPGLIEYPSTTTVRLTFSAGVAGDAYLS